MVLGRSAYPYFQEVVTPLPVLGAAGSFFKVDKFHHFGG
jgi:hypothetical protein